VSERLRVLVVPKWYPRPDRPVFGIFCREHARALATRHDVVVLASLAVSRPSFVGFQLEESVEDGIRTLRVHYRRPFLRPVAMGFQLLGMLAGLRRLRRDGWRPDVVHAHVYQAAPPALILARLSGAVTAVTEHYTGFQRGLVNGYDQTLARLSFEHAGVVAPVSRELAGHLRELAPRARIEVVPNVVDTAAFSPPTTRTPGRALLTVAALAEKKGQRFLLDALADVPEATLDVVGDGELRATLERQASALGLDGRVRFHGERPKEEVSELMRQADLFVLPSLAENLPVALIEAQASGLPAVATRVGGVPELVDERAGALVEPGDAATLAAAIRETLERLSDFDPAALAARARERYGYDAVCARWTEIYADLRSSSAGTTRFATSSRSAASE
jgi:glycosyltransferase involved in cell wall biosynthesis